MFLWHHEKAKVGMIDIVKTVHQSKAIFYLNFGAQKDILWSAGKVKKDKNEYK